MDEDIDQLRQRMEKANLFAYIRNAEGDEQFYQEMREALALIGALMRDAEEPPILSPFQPHGAALARRNRNETPTEPVERVERRRPV